MHPRGWDGFHIQSPTPELLKALWRKPGAAGYKKTGCLHQDGSLCVHPQQSQGLQTAELWLLQLRRGKDFSRLIVPGKLNGPCFRFGQPKPCRLFLPLHKISEVTKLLSFLWYQKKKSHYGWMQGTDLTHNRWFLPASDKACFLQLITSPENTHDVCFPKQILHSKPTCLHLPPSKGKNQVVQFLSKSVYFYLFSMEGSVCAKGVGGQS